MNQFNKIVLTIATIILIVSLSFIAFFLAKSLFEDSYPPIISECPDYWDVDYNSDNQIVCKNTSTINEGRGGVSGDRCNIPSEGINPITLFDSQATGSGNNEDSVLCEKYRWARECNITWDGVTNNNNACNLGYY